MSKRSIPNVDWANQLESVIRQFVKEKLELIMREEIKHFLEIEQADTSNMRNGYYQRNLDTQYGRIEGLLVPRDRNGEFQTQLFAPYQRHTGWLAGDSPTALQKRRQGSASGRIRWTTGAGGSL